MSNPHATGHIVLLGDSIFDNGAYVGGAPDATARLATGNLAANSLVIAA